MKNLKDWKTFNESKLNEAFKSMEELNDTERLELLYHLRKLAGEESSNIKEEWFTKSKVYDDVRYGIEYDDKDIFNRIDVNKLHCAWFEKNFNFIVLVEDLGFFHVHKDSECWPLPTVQEAMDAASGIPDYDGPSDGDAWSGGFADNH